MLTVVPMTLRQANEFIALHHRHHKRVPGCKFSVGAWDGDKVCGVAVVGRPVSRVLDDGLTAEVVRLCTDGTRNACSLLYGACRRASFAMGYRVLLTYTLPDEGGASLRAAGFVLVHKTDGGSWDCPSRPRGNHSPLCPKWRWEARRS